MIEELDLKSVSEIKEKTAEVLKLFMGFDLDPMSVLVVLQTVSSGIVFGLTKGDLEKSCELFNLMSKSCCESAEEMWDKMNEKSQTLH
jgi:hypothetical protein